MGAKIPLLLALAISLLGHLAFVLLYPNITRQRPVARFDVELVLPADELPAELEEIAPLPEPIDPASEAIEPSEEVTTPEEEVAIAAATVSPGPVTEAAPPRTILNLSRPPDWETIIRDIPAPGPELAFNPTLGEALRQRETERRRLALVGDRQAAVYGVADEDYGRTGPLGKQLKMDGGCVTLVEDRDVEEGQRWWASQCTETRQNRFTLPEIDYDALGRAVVE